ncbi:hypothetical protein P4V04_06775 [Bacillus subtilis]|nr:hypothetical protein [Bacillus subtilis]
MPTNTEFPYRSVKPLVIKVRTVIASKGQIDLSIELIANCEDQNLLEDLPVSLTYEIAKPSSESTEFKYDLVDQSTAEFLKQKEVNMREIAGKAYTELGRELKEAQEKLAGNNHYNGMFEKWLKSIGVKKATAYKLIQRFNLLLVHNVDEQELLEDLPVSLTYEIAGCSRISRRQKLDRRFAHSGIPSQNCALLIFKPNSI